MASGIVDLTSDQLRRLARTLYLQEVEAIHDIKFTSEHELVQYLQECKKGYEHTLQILDASNELVAKYQGDATKESIAHEIYSYTKIAVNTSMQTFRSFTLRLQYLEKIREHTKEISLDLEFLDRYDLAAVEDLAKEAIRYKKVLLEYNSKYQNILASPLSKWIEQSGLTFEELVKKYQTILELPGEFKDLKRFEKLKIYHRIIEESGVGNFKMTAFEAATGAAGLAVLLFTAGTIVWDLATSHHKVHTAATDGVMILSSVAGNMIGTVVKTVLTAECLCLVETSSVAIPVIGFVVGCVAGYVLSKIGDFFIDLIFGSGSGSAPVLPLSTDGHRCYPVKLPDGKVLARQIVHYS